MPLLLTVAEQPKTQAVTRLVSAALVQLKPPPFVSDVFPPFARVRPWLLLRVLIVLHLQRLKRRLVGRHLLVAIAVVLRLDLVLPRPRDLSVLRTVRRVFLTRPNLVAHLPKFRVLAAAVLR